MTNFFQVPINQIIRNQVLDQLEKAGLRARKEKCEFLANSVTYLGHKIDSEGLHPQAIQNAS